MPRANRSIRPPGQNVLTGRGNDVICGPIDQGGDLDDVIADRIGEINSGNDACFDQVGAS